LRKILLLGVGALCATVAAVCAQPAEPARKTVVHDPVFSSAQADRGKALYAANCAGCHLAGLDGSANPTANVKGLPLLGPHFVQDFGEAKVSALFNRMQRDMPKDKPGTLSEQQYLDIAAYVLQQNKFPAGAKDLTVDTATDVWIPGAGGAEGLVDYTFVSGVGCLSQDPTRSWMLVKAQGLKQNNPRLIQAEKSNNFTLYNIDLLNAANFHVVYENATGFTAWGVRIKTPATADNTDGIDPSGAVNVTIANSYIMDGDDGIAVKAGSVASKNITIKNDHFYGTHGISVGSETNDGVSNVLMAARRAIQ